MKRIAGCAGAAAVAAAGGAMMMAAPAAAKSLGQMASDAAADLEGLTGLLAVLFYLVGALFVAFGLLKLKRTADQPQQGTSGAGLAAIVLGVALILTPVVINALSDTIGADTTQTIDRPRL